MWEHKIRVYILSRVTEEKEVTQVQKVLLVLRENQVSFSTLILMFSHFETVMELLGTT